MSDYTVGQQTGAPVLDEMTLAWQVFLAESTGDGLYIRKPLLYNDILIVSVHNGSAGTDTLLGLSSTDGSMIWNYPIEYNTQIVVSQKGYCFLVFDNRFVVLNASTGEEESNAETGFDDGMSFSIAIDDDMHFFIGSRSQTPNAEALLSIVALDNDGDELWNYSTIGKLTSTLVCTNNYIIFGTGQGYVEYTSGTLHILDASSGAELFSPVYRDPVLAITVLDAIAYVVTAQFYLESYTGVVHAIDLNSQREIWQYSGNVGDTKPIILNKSIILGLYNDYPTTESGVISLNSATGELEWFYSITNPNRGPTCFTSNGDTVFFGETDPRPGVPSGRGAIHALNSLGEELWQYETAGVVGDPVYANGILYFACRDGFLYSLK